MAYGGKDGLLDKGFVCFVRPARSNTGSRKRKYSVRDLTRIFGYVAAEDGLTESYCAIAGNIGITAEIRSALDAMRDIPCVDTDITGLLPAGIVDEIERELGSDVDALQGCDPETNIGQKIKSAVAILVTLVVILKRVLNNRIIKFVLRRILILGVLLALVEKLEDIVIALIKTADLLQGIAEVLEVLACQRDENGELKRLSTVFNLPPELEVLD